MASRAALRREEGTRGLDLVAGLIGALTGPDEHRHPDRPRTCTSPGGHDPSGLRHRVQGLRTPDPRASSKLVAAFPVIRTSTSGWRGGREGSARSRLGPRADAGQTAMSATVYGPSTRPEPRPRPATGRRSDTSSRSRGGLRAVENALNAEHERRGVGVVRGQLGAVVEQVLVARVDVQLGDLRSDDVDEAACGVQFALQAEERVLLHAVDLHRELPSGQGPTAHSPVTGRKASYSRAPRAPGRSGQHLRGADSQLIPANTS